MGDGICGCVFEKEGYQSSALIGKIANDQEDYDEEDDGSAAHGEAEVWTGGWRVYRCMESPGEGSKLRGVLGDHHRIMYRTTLVVVEKKIQQRGPL